MPQKDLYLIGVVLGAVFLCVYGSQIYDSKSDQIRWGGLESRTATVAETEKADNSPLRDLHGVIGENLTPKLSESVEFDPPTKTELVELDSDKFAERRFAERKLAERRFAEAKLAEAKLAEAKSIALEYAEPAEPMLVEPEARGFANRQTANVHQDVQQTIEHDGSESLLLTPPKAIDTAIASNDFVASARQLPEKPNDENQLLTLETEKTPEYSQVIVESPAGDNKSVAIKLDQVPKGYGVSIQLTPDNTSDISTDQQPVAAPVIDNTAEEITSAGFETQGSDFYLELEEPSVDHTHPVDFERRSEAGLYGVVKVDDSPVSFDSYEIENLPKIDRVATDARVVPGVRKVNWEQIEPIATSVGLSPKRYPRLNRIVGLPENEQRAFLVVEKGKALARRGAYFAAKQEFLKALHLVAESNDRVMGGRAYSESLSAGLVALKELKDFDISLGSVEEQSMSLGLILASHSTKTIDPNFVHQLSPTKAIEVYSDFARVRIEQAVGQSMASSSALYCLSRLLKTAPELYGDSAVPKSDVQAAMLLASYAAHPANFDSSNELGLLFFQRGQYNDAAQWFHNAVRSSGGKQLFWRNLAEAHQRFAQSTQIVSSQQEHMRLAQLAFKESQIAPELQKSKPLISGWVSSEQFQQNAAIPAPVVQAPVTQTQGLNASFQVPAAREASGRPLVNKIKDWF